jgi:hypothetical protein
MKGMETPEPQQPSPLKKPEPAGFSGRHLLIWLPAAAGAGLLVAWSAVVAEKYFAPFVVFPLLVGVLLSGILIALMRLLQVGHRPTILAGAILAVGLAVAGEHGFLYWQAQRERSADPLRDALFPERVPPEGFWRYLEWETEQGRKIGGYRLTGGGVWALWAFHALLIAAPALTLVVATARLPYCDECQRWYHVIRARKIDPATAQRLAALAGVSIPSGARSVRVRLVACPRGCSPAGLALFSEESGDAAADYTWIDAPARDEVLKVLKEQRARRRRLRRRRQQE